MPSNRSKRRAKRRKPVKGFKMPSNQGQRGAKRRKLSARSCFCDTGKEKVDKSDHQIAEELFNLSKQFNKTRNDVLCCARSLYDYRADGRISMLRIPQLGRPIPEDILRLDALEELKINCHDMGKIPNWFPCGFGSLTNVKKLMLSLGEGKLLPEEISGLQKLELLHITANKRVIIPRSFGNLENLHNIFIQIEHPGGSVSFPNSIGGFTNLKNIEILNVGELPEDYDCFASLESFHARGSFRAIPSSIGSLKKLKKLSLWRFYDRIRITEGDPVITVPDEIGDMTSLEEICLEMNVKTLPSSIGKLKSLKRLDVDGTTINSLPDEIGDAINLEKLDLGNTSTSTLPSTLTNLKKLRRLHLSDEMLRAETSLQFQMIANLINHLPQLGCLGYRHRLRYDLSIPEPLSFAYKLLHNRVRTRLNSLNSTEGEGSLPLAAWPLAFQQAKKLFRPYGYQGEADIDKSSHSKCWCCQGEPIKRDYTQPDAIFQILVSHGALITAKGND